MTISLMLGIVCALVAAALPIALRGRPYSAPPARVACGLWVISFASLTYWVWATVEEGIIKTILLVLGGMLAFGAFLQMLKSDPLRR